MVFNVYHSDAVDADLNNAIAVVLYSPRARLGGLGMLQNRKRVSTKYLQSKKYIYLNHKLQEEDNVRKSSDSVSTSIIISPSSFWVTGTILPANTMYQEYLNTT